MPATSTVGFNDVIFTSNNITLDFTYYTESRPGAYVVFGHGGRFAPVLRLRYLEGADGFAIAAPADPYRGFGMFGGAGDVNGDEVDDLVIGRPSESPTDQQETPEGRTYVV